MRSNRPRAHDHSPLSLTQNFNASNVDGYAKSAISSRGIRTQGQRFGKRLTRTSSRTKQRHITTECGNMTGAMCSACVLGWVTTHDVLATRLSRAEWAPAPCAPDAAASSPPAGVPHYAPAPPALVSQPPSPLTPIYIPIHIPQGKTVTKKKTNTP